MKCTINEFPCFYAAVTVLQLIWHCVNKRNEILSPFSKCMRHKGQCCMGKHKLCLKMMANWPAANRILWRLIVAWSHPGFGGWNPDPSGSCIVIHKERLKNNRRNNWTIHIKKQRKIIAHQNKAVCPPPGHDFPHCVVARRGQTLQMYRQPGLRSQFQELSLLFLCSWLLSPLHPWVSSNIWPCFGPDWAYNQAQRTTKFSWRKNTESIVRPCLYGRGSVCRCTHTHAEATLANPIPLKALCGFSTW